MATEFINGQWRIPNSWNVDESNQNKISNYSMKFNGTSDSVNVGVSPPPLNTSFQKASFSLWAKTTAWGTPSSGFTLFNNRPNAFSGIALNTFTSSMYLYPIGMASNISFNMSNSGFIDDEWNHIAISIDSTKPVATDRIKIYINGVSATLTGVITLNSTFTQSTADFTIGSGSRGFYDGEIDMFCMFDYALSSSQVTTLYGNSAAGYFQIGNPMALTPNPVAFYPLGDQDLIGAGYNGANWLVPNQVAAGGDVFQSVPLRTTNSVPTDTITSNINYTGTPAIPSPFTVSFWMKDSVVGNASVFFDHDASTYTTTTPKGAFVYFTGGKVLIYLASDYWRYYSLPSGVALTDNEWRNIVVYINPLNQALGKVWIDGTPLGLSNSNASGSANNFTAGFRFYLNNFGSNVMYFKDYEIDNAGATLLYNNGAPLLDTSTLAQAPDHWWKLNASDTFDIATNTWTINDHIGSENGTSVNMDASNLTPSELPNTGGLQGYSPYAIELNGTDQVFNCGNDSSLQITGAMTVSYWFKGQGGSGNVVGGVGKLGGSSSRGFCLGMISSGNITFYIAPTASSLISAGYSHTPDTNWHHLLGVFNPSTSLELYFDGQLVDTTLTSTSSQYNASNNLQIGARGDSTGFFDGQLSNVAIWGSGLSASQVTTIYNNGIPGDISSLNPLAWWELGSMMGFNGSDTYTALSNTDSNFAAVSTSNMAAVDVVNGPGYSNGGSGTSSLVIGKQAPYSFNNALSESMAISNRDDSQITDPYPLMLELDLTGETSSYNFITPLLSAGTTFPFTMDWGDGTVETITSSSQFVQVGRLSHTYDTDTYPRPVIQIGKSTDVGQVVDFRVTNAGSKLQLFDLKQFGQATFQLFNLYNAQKMLITAKDNLKFGGSTLAGAFQSAFKANPTTVNNWDISSVSTANKLFYQATEFNQDLNNWDTSSTRPGQSDPGIINLCSLTFTTDSIFNGDITNWFTTRSTSMNQMFSGCIAFNRDISTKYISAANSPTGSAYVAWDTQNITTLASAFFNATSFNQDISNWNTSKVTSMSTVFSGAIAFNQDISTKQVTVNGVTYTAWNVSKVTNMSGMLKNTVFNNTLDNWELSANLSSMSQMFIGNNTISDENFSDNWAIFANSVKDDNSASGGTAPNFPRGVNATTQNNNAKIKVSRSAPTSSGGVQHFTTVGRALSYLTSDVQITFIEEEEEALQLYTADFLDTATSSYPTKLVGVSVPNFTFEWSGTVWEFKNSGTTVDTDTGGATLQEGPEDGTWNILTVVTANQNWNFSNTGTVYTT